MKGKGIKVFGVVMALLLVFSFAATFSVSSTVSAGTQKWTQISIPGTDDMQLAPNTEVGAIAVSPDGATLFAAVFVQAACTLPGLTVGDWYVFKSSDGGYTWKTTEFADDGTPIVAIKTSPAWLDDGVVVVATQNESYISEKRGNDFQSMGFQAAIAGVQVISSFDISLDNDGDATFVLGTSGAAGEVYLLSGFSGWTPQYIEDPDSNPLSAYSFTRGVLSVAFSPNYAEDGVIFAVVGGIADSTMPIDGTHLRAESDVSVNNWGSFIDDARFVDEPTGDNIVANSSCIAFANDYNSAPSVFVGLTAYENWTTKEARGDAFRVDLVMGSMGTSAIDDLDIRGEGSRTNVYSLAVSGSAASAFMLAGLRDLSNSGPMTTWQGTVHYSSNGGESWLQSYKPPSGLLAEITPYIMGHGSPTVLMAPDFAESGIAYCGTGIDPIFGELQGFGGVYVSTTEGTTFNGRGLLDCTIDNILDVVPSPKYDEDSTLFMVTQFATLGLLWETMDGGSDWELILSMTLMIPLPGVSIDKIEIPADYPTQPSLFVTGETAATGGPNGLIVRSTDEGNLWASTLKSPYIGSDVQIIKAWKVIDKDTLIVASADKIWKTTDMGAHWIQEDGSNITGNVTDMQLFNDTTIIVGTDRGNVYMCQDWDTDFSFAQVDKGPGVASDKVYVVFDTNFDDNGMIYAGINGSPATCGIWRIDANSGDEWQQIYDPTIPEDILSIACDGNGILWAISDDGGPTLRSVSVREVNPTAPIDDIDFEYVTTGLTSDLWFDLETAPMQTYVFAIGGGVNSSVPHTELWAYIDTLIQPTLISPACGATAAGTILQGTSTARVSLMWDDLAKAQYYDYEVAYDDGFGSIAAADWLEGTQVSVNLVLGEQYYWRVRVNGSVFSKWSEVCSFTTPLGPASAKPIVTYPGATDSHNDIELTPSLTWTSTVEATGFELILAANCDWANPIVNLTGSSALVGPDTCYAITQALQEGTNYCWKVRAVNSDTDTMSPWSDTGTFTTLVTPVVEDEGTPMWVWVVIALSAVLLVGVVVLIVRTRRPV